MTEIVICLLIGIVAGILGGLLGIGGGIIIVPALVFFLGFSQCQAQGTTLALMVPPIGLLAALTYYNNGFVDLKVAGIICIGFFIGGFFGAKIAMCLSNNTLQRLFGIVFLIIAVKMIFGK